MHAIHFFSLCECEVHCRFAAVTACFDVEGHCLTVVQLTDASTLHCGDVNEHVLVAVCWCDKAEAFGCVKPFHGAISHRVSPKFGMPSAECDDVAQS